MNYKKRLTLLFVGLFLMVLTAILSYIYVSYADFRRDAFFERLREKSFSTVRLLAEVHQIDRDLLKIIDRNTINEMYDEKVLIFNEKNQLIYSSLDDETIPYSIDMIEQIRHKADKYYVDDDGDEVVGVHYTDFGHDYVVLASAYDQHGITKLGTLRNLIIGALFGGTVLIAFSSYFYIRQIFRPIDQLNRSIEKITENNLREFIPVKDHQDELNILARNYNRMLARLYQAFEAQKSFVRNASHELKTPLARMQSKLEKLQASAGPETAPVVSSLIEEINGQASLVESLMLMQRLQSQWPVPKSTLRVDELLDEAVSEVKSNHPHLNIKIDISESIVADNQLTVNGNAMLLKMCFKNLLTNAALYASSRDVIITLTSEGTFLSVAFGNAGEEALPPEIFEPFYRHVTAEDNTGSGLGLSIVRQISATLNGRIDYAFEGTTHVFTLTMPHI